MIDHFCGLVRGGLCSEPSLGPHADNMRIQLDLTQLFCPGFTLAAGPPSSFTTDGVGCWGVALWRACDLTSLSPRLTDPVDYPSASCHKGHRFKTPGGVLMWNRDSPVSIVSLQFSISSRNIAQLSTAKQKLAVIPQLDRGSSGTSNSPLQKNKSEFDVCNGCDTINSIECRKFHTPTTVYCFPSVCTWTARTGTPSSPPPTSYFHRPGQLIHCKHTTCFSPLHDHQWTTNMNNQKNQSIWLLTF